MLAVACDEAHFKDKVESAVTSRLQTIDAARPIDDLLPIFDVGHVAIVMGGDKFQGLITRIDLLNHLRRKMR